MGFREVQVYQNDDFLACYVWSIKEDNFNPFGVDVYWFYVLIHIKLSSMNEKKFFCISGKDAFFWDIISTQSGHRCLLPRREIPPESQELGRTLEEDADKTVLVDHPRPVKRDETDLSLEKAEETSTLLFLLG